MSSKILVVEDDPTVRRLVEFVLEQDGFEVFAFEGGAAALEALDAVAPDLAIVDLMMPDIDGIEVTRQIRARSQFNKTPILVVTAKTHTVDKYEAFSAGADDYIVKPFDPLELTFRVRSYLRLTSGEGGQAIGPLDLGRVRLEPARYTVFIDDQEIQLTKLETAVLHYLMSHRDEVISAEQIAQRVLGQGSGAAARSVDAAQAHIRHLRQKLESDPSQPAIIVTVGRKGYRFTA
jgi:DNA-binding response OmpR family regulator